MDAELADPFDPPTTFEYPSVNKSMQLHAFS